MNRRIASGALLSSLVLFSGLSVSALPDARGATLQLIAAFKAVEPAVGGKPLTAASQEKNAQQFKKLDALLHEPSIVGTPIAPHKDKFTAQQLTEFKRLFWSTLRLVAYPSSGEFFHKAKYELKAPTRKSGVSSVRLHAELVEEDIETDVTFHWKLISGKLRLVDVSFDGASLMLDYKNQFGRIINKSGVEGLLNALRKKHREAQATKVTSER